MEKFSGMANRPITDNEWRLVETVLHRSNAPNPSYLETVTRYRLAVFLERLDPEQRRAVDALYEAHKALPKAIPDTIENLFLFLAEEEAERHRATL